MRKPQSDLPDSHCFGIHLVFDCAGETLAGLLAFIERHRLKVSIVVHDKGFGTSHAGVMAMPVPLEIITDGL